MASLNLGIALSDANHADRPTGLRIPDSLPLYAQRLAEATGSGPFIELQPAEPFSVPARYPDQFRLNRDNCWLNAVEFNDEVQAFIDGQAARLGVHQPQKGDPLASNFFGKYGALEEIRRAMDFAAGVRADYFVFNLAKLDKWEWSRSDQMHKALKVYKEIAAYYRSYGYEYVPCIETLEYPKFPSTGGETLHLLNECRKILGNTAIALNISHLWRSRNLMMATGNWDDATVSFIDHLEYTLSRLWEDLYVVHLGGCWESETHAIPGLHPQASPFDHPLKLRETSGVYAESGEIDLNQTLDLLLEFTIGKGRDLNLVIEIHDRDVGQVMEAVRQISDDLHDRIRTKWAIDGN